MDEKHTAMVDPSGEAAVFDPSKLETIVQSSSANRLVIAKLVGGVLERGGAQLEPARLAYHAGRTDEAMALLHTLRGSVGTLGAARFAAAGLTLELAIRQGRDDTVAALFVRARAELEAALAAMQAWLAPAHPVTLDAPALARLVDLLGAGDAGAAQAYDALRPALLARLGAQALVQLDQMIALPDFARAQALIARIAVVLA